MISVRTLQPETQAAMKQLAVGTIAEESMRCGIAYGEPLITTMDSMIRYAKAYTKAYGAKVGDDGLLGDHYRDVIRGLRGLLNGQGVAAMEHGITTDTKDNGMIESMYWTACELAGIDGDR